MFESLDRLVQLATGGSLEEANPWHRKDGTFGVDAGGEGVWSFVYKEGPNKGKRYWAKARKDIGRDGAPIRYERNKDGSIKKGADGKPEKFDGRARIKGIGDKCGRDGGGHCFKHGDEKYEKGKGALGTKRGFTDTHYAPDEKDEKGKIARRGGEAQKRKVKGEVDIEKGHGVEARHLKASDWAAIAGSQRRSKPKPKAGNE